MAILRETEKPCVICRNRSTGFQPVGLTGVSPVDSLPQQLLPWRQSLLSANSIHPQRRLRPPLSPKRASRYFHFKTSVPIRITPTSPMVSRRRF